MPIVVGKDRDEEMQSERQDATLQSADTPLHRRFRPGIGFSKKAELYVMLPIATYDS